jgi:predicted transcriptional regulator of viral defense system
MTPSHSPGDQPLQPNLSLREGLFLVASAQAGYFTTGQATAAGWRSQLLSHHARVGTIQRVYRGVYRFREYPFTQREEIVAAWLAVGKDVAVVSHESALDIWGLTDLIPDAIHLTVPRKKRNLPKLPGVTFHVPSNRYRVQDDEVRTVESSLRVTSPQRTLLDIAVAGVSPEHVIIGIRQARAKGWIDAPKLRQDAQGRGRRIAEMVDEALHADDVRAAESG